MPLVRDLDHHQLWVEAASATPAQAALVVPVETLVVAVAVVEEGLGRQLQDLLQVHTLAALVELEHQEL
jgi:hypothetical protein